MRVDQDEEHPLAFWVQVLWDASEWELRVDQVFNHYNADDGPPSALKLAERHLDQLVQDRALKHEAVMNAIELGGFAGVADLDEQRGVGTWIKVWFNSPDEAALFKLTWVGRLS